MYRKPLAPLLHGRAHLGARPDEPVLPVELKRFLAVTLPWERRWKKTFLHSFIVWMKNIFIHFPLRRNIAPSPLTLAFSYERGCQCSLTGVQHV
jgi:hypothetical protein